MVPSVGTLVVTLTAAVWERSFIDSLVVASRQTPTRTARDCKYDNDQLPGDVSDAPSFRIPARPERVYTASGGVSYEGETVFSLVPTGDVDDETLAETLEGIFERERYVSGDWFDLPAPLYLVHDREISTSFRVVVRRGQIELHVLPDTESAGLEALYEALAGATDHDWTVECRTTADE